MKRDVKGRFIKDEDDNSKGYKFSLTFPSLTNLIYWISIGYLLELLFFLGLLFLKDPTYCIKYRIFSIMYLLLKMITKLQKRMVYSIK